MPLVSPLSMGLALLFLRPQCLLAWSSPCVLLLRQPPRVRCQSIGRNERVPSSRRWRFSTSSSKPTTPDEAADARAVLDHRTASRHRDQMKTDNNTADAENITDDLVPPVGCQRGGAIPVALEGLRSSSSSTLTIAMTMPSGDRCVGTDMLLRRRHRIAVRPLADLPPNCAISGSMKRLQRDKPGPGQPVLPRITRTEAALQKLFWTTEDHWLPATLPTR
ncbi:hypothetical protein FN846DRAFT_886225 [Sphaerosporella brunnea]|uniref:Secreted protein n=1 Tax=Sphaerosporella brunnea TaxID=1250544 RepID=A0A5J5F9W3_9PEZI|nr:hypothetical protein FN846DRAFT_886225 [Sphaerosporella brunnea]